jgi:hypothetical protein
MKRCSTALLFGLLSLTSQLAHADIVDDAIGNIQQAINDAYNPSSSRSNDDDAMTVTVAVVSPTIDGTMTVADSLKTDVSV